MPNRTSNLEKTELERVQVQPVTSFFGLFFPLVKDLFDWGHNPSHSTLYPDVLKIKTTIVEKKNFAKMPFVYYLLYKSISDISAAWTTAHP